MVPPGRPRPADETTGYSVFIVNTGGRIPRDQLARIIRNHRNISERQAVAEAGRGRIPIMRNVSKEDAERCADALRTKSIQVEISKPGGG